MGSHSFDLHDIYWMLAVSPADIPQPDDVFYLADRNGHATTAFTQGEDFYMYFNLVNTTEDTLDYSVGNSGPAVRFAIYQGSECISSSTDGLAFLCVVLDYKLAPGDTIKGFWLAPTAPIHSTKINLSPGQYKAVAEFPVIQALDTDSIRDIVFTVTME